MPSLDDALDLLAGTGQGPTIGAVSSTKGSTMFDKDIQALHAALRQLDDAAAALRAVRARLKVEAAEAEIAELAR